MQPQTTAAAPLVTYGRMKQTHPDYQGELWERLGLLYEGGWEMLKQAGKFIQQAPRENSVYYKWRCDSTSYVNYLARLVGYLAGSLFNDSLVIGPEKDPKTDKPQPLPDVPFYSAFSTDCDKKGTDFSQFMRAEALVNAMVYSSALVAVDMPPAPRLETGERPDNRAQEEALGGARAYLVSLDIGSLFNWEKDDFGRFKWCVLHRIVRDRSNPFGDHSIYQHEFKVWSLALVAPATVDDTGLRAVYTVLRSKAVSKDEELTDADELQIVTLAEETSFREIPILEFQLPKALWVGNQAGPLCQEHFQRRSDLKGSLCRSLVEMRYIKLGPEIPAVHGALPSERGQDPSRGDDALLQMQEQGQVTLGHQDEIGYAGPSGIGHQLARDELKDVREEIFASVNAMALQLENSAAAVGRSGDSKAEDKSALEVILTFMGDQLREYSQRVMTLVSAARGEDVKWAASGLATFDTEDRTEIVTEAGELNLLSIPSRTWKVKHLTNLALATVPKATAKEKEAIAKEIDKNVTEESVTMDPIERARQMAAGGGTGDDDEDDEGGQNLGNQPFGKPAAAE